jgi:hypothetical protein
MKQSTVTRASNLPVNSARCQCYADDKAGSKRDSFTLADDADEYLIVYGVNHAATGKTIYSNFGMYGEKTINGVGAVANEALTGTAEAYLEPSCRQVPICL